MKRTLLLAVVVAVAATCSNGWESVAAAPMSKASANGSQRGLARGSEDTAGALRDMRIPPVSTGSAANPARRMTGSAARPPFRRSVVVSCLRRRGVAVGPVQPSNTRLRALRDLAQKTSVQARVGRDVVGLAFTRTESEAQFLIELLEVPKDPYRLALRRNVVLLYRPAPSRARTAVSACLR